MRKLPVLVVALMLVVIAAVTRLQQHTDAGRQAQLGVASLTSALTELRALPFTADPHAGGSPALVRLEINRDERVLFSGLASSSRVDASRSSLASARRSLVGVDAAVAGIYSLATSSAGSSSTQHILGLLEHLTVGSDQLSVVLRRIGAAAEALAGENETLLGLSQREASTDALTGIANRGALIDDLEPQIHSGRSEPELLLAMFESDRSRR